MKEYKIYTLSDIDNNIFYVGITIHSLKVRLSGHIADARQYATFDRGVKEGMINSLKEKIFIKEVDNAIGSKEARKKEIFWIKKTINDGYCLTNKQITNSNNDYSVFEIAALCFVFDRDIKTICRWIKQNNNDYLSSDRAKKAILKAKEFENIMQKI